MYPEGRAEFVWHMEDVLDLYAEPYDPDHPVVCFDERPCQLLADVRPSEPVQPGRPARVDYNYRRNGTYNVFTAFQPLVGWRHVEVTTRRACADFSHAPRPAALNTCGGAPDVLRFSVRKVIE